MIAPVFERRRDQPEDGATLERVAHPRSVDAAHDRDRTLIGDGTELGWNLRLSYCGRFGTLGCHTSNVRHRTPAAVVLGRAPLRFSGCLEPGSYRDELVSSLRALRSGGSSKGWETPLIGLSTNGAAVSTERDGRLPLRTSGRPEWR